MPPYLTFKDNTFYFRQGIPAELRSLIGKREIKKSLGQDYVRAVSECKRYAVVADLLIAEARAKLDSIPVEPYSREGIRRTRHVPLTEVTPALEAEFTNLVRESLLDTDRKTRIAGMDVAEFQEYSQHIEDSLTALRRQLAMGNVDPMLESARLLLIGRGYLPEFSAEDWRRIAYAMTQASLEAYEGIAARQKGAVVKGQDDPILPSQFEIQNAVKTESAPANDAVTWQVLYDVWIKECQRPANTHAA